MTLTPDWARLPPLDDGGLGSMDDIDDLTGAELLAAMRNRLARCERDRSGEKERRLKDKAEQNLVAAVHRVSLRGWTKKEIRQIVSKSLKVL